MLEYKLGYFAESLCGHDKGRLYMIVRIEGDRVGLCDGERRCLAGPKYKKKKHIQIIRSECAAQAFEGWIADGQPDLKIRDAVRSLERRRKESRR